MENIQISSREDLASHIRYLSGIKIVYEEDLKYTLKEIARSYTPSSIVEESLHKLAEDKGVQMDLAEAGLNLGAGLIIEEVLSKNNSFKGFLRSLLAKRISAFFLNKNSYTIISGLNKLIQGTNRNQNGYQLQSNS
jgi:hypothetical protein